MDLTGLIKHFIKRPRGADTVYYVDGTKTVISRNCSCCNEIKLLAEFNKSKHGFAGRQSMCKVCSSLNGYGGYFERTTLFGIDVIGRKNTRGTLFYESLDGQVIAKKCSKCDETKELNDFPKGISIGDRQSSCSKCKFPNHYYRDEINLFGESLIAKKTNTGIVYCENKVGEIIAKECSKCNEIKLLDGFSNGTIGGFAGKLAKCRECYPEEARVRRNNRRALELNLPATLTVRVDEQLLNEQTYTCVTGVRLGEIIALDHFIPISWGHGGTTPENTVYLTMEANSRKNDRIPFEWIKTESEEAQERFYTIILPMIAERNGLTVGEYKDFVYWCEANKRTAEEVEADNLKYGYKKPSIELWKESTLVNV